MGSGVDWIRGAVVAWCGGEFPSFALILNGVILNGVYRCMCLGCNKQVRSCLSYFIKLADVSD